MITDQVNVPPGPPWTTKDNEFIAWYPPDLSAEAAAAVWAPREAAFYVHIPFCTAICDYCGFAVTKHRSGADHDYVSALHTEIDRYADAGRLAPYRFACGHVGGGTPSVLPAAVLVGILDHLRRVTDVAGDAELTVEVNPISFTRDKADDYLNGGVNRISIGIQSFDETTLRTIGRPHRRSDVDAALAAAHDSGVRNLSLDLIYGVPGQTMASLRDDLCRAVDTGATHLSCFRLEIIPFTVLKLRESTGGLPPRLTTAELDAMDDLVAQVLIDSGFVEYGAFNFARPGFDSVHNRIAFMAPQGDYLGFGNGAYSFAHDTVYANEARVDAYLDLVGAGHDPVAFARRATALELMSRYFVLGLKFFHIPRTPFVERFGLAPEDVFGDRIDRLLDSGHLSRVPDGYRLTDLGRRYVNNVCKQFYVGSSVGRRQQVQFVPTLTVNQILGYARRAGLDAEHA